MKNYSKSIHHSHSEPIVEHYTDFRSEYVHPRNIDVYLPPGYREDRLYPVVYMHDGQNMFDPSTSFGGVDWGVDEAIAELLRHKKIMAPIVVAIWNTPLRMTEYMPAKAFDLLSGADKDKLSRAYKKTFHVQLEPVLSDNYLKFIVHELKHFIDAHYNTLKYRESTFIMGSSMGGLISLYALAEYPQIFGGAAGISTHWTAGNGIVIRYLYENMPWPGHHKVYFDFGTETVDKDYEPYQDKMDQVMQAKGYTHGHDWLTLKFPGAEHSESAWRERIHLPFHFFLGH
jgi:predicted alpha/beta superfamily hydrolase